MDQCAIGNIRLTSMFFLAGRYLWLGSGILVPEICK
jgi:hypothetical protein